MKRMIKVIGILLVSLFLLLPLKTSAAEPVWSQDLDLNDSVSSAIAKVEDGVVVMQYEGAASANNLLIKYDFNGKKIWEIDNDYGYNIESVSDGFIVWNETQITKFDKDKNIMWSKDVDLKPTDADDNGSYIGAGLGEKLVELDDYYVIYQVHFLHRLRNDIFIFDKNGNIIQRMSINDFLKKNNISSGDFWIYTIDYLSDNKFILMYKTSNFWSSEPIHIAEITSDFTVIKDTEYQLDASMISSSYYGVDIRNVIPTDKGYISFGSNIIYLLSSGKIKIYNKLVLDAIKTENYIYTYEIREKSIRYNNDMLYDTYIVQYDMDMEEKNSIQLPLSLNGANCYSGLALLKNRFILGNEGNIVVLNTPIKFNCSFNSAKEYFCNYSNIYEMQQGNYALASYHFADDKTQSTDDNNSNISGIINNIIKNPQTNSIIIIIVFIVLILAISTVSYFVYRKNIKKKDIKK